MKDNISAELLSYIHRYYPIGMPFLYNQPRVKNERDFIVERKINEITQEQITDWSKFVEYLKNQGLDVLDLSHRQFPNYLFHIKLDNPLEDQGKVLSTRSLVLIISLLCPYYTVFFEDYYRFDEIRTPERKVGPGFRILFTQVFPESQYLQDRISTLKQEVENRFPKYSFLPHDVAFGQTVDGGDLQLEGRPEKGVRPVFSFLFDDSYALKNLEVRP